MKRWGIEPIDWSLTEDEAVRKLGQEGSMDLDVCNEAAIGLAFAVIKMRGTCPPDVLQLGLDALTRTAIAVKDSVLSNEAMAEWDLAITRMRNKLKSLRRPDVEEDTQADDRREHGAEGAD
jgi:uncharacterized protein YfeS